MSKFLNNVLAICFLMISIGCEKKVDENGSSIDLIVETGANEWFDLSELVDTLVIVPLETKEDALIGSISKVFTTEDYIFVLDKSFAESLFVFDWKGNLRKIFAGTGEGPREFLRSTNFFVNEEKGTVLILDGSLGKIVEYSFDGDFVHEVKNDPKLWVYDLYSVPNGFFSVKTRVDNSGKFVDFIDEKLKFQRILVDLNDEINVVGGEKMQHFFGGSNEEIYFKQLLSNKIYVLSPSGQIETTIDFSFQNRNWTPSVDPIHPRDAYREIRDQNTLALSDEFLDFKKFLLFNYWEGGELKSAVFDKTKRISFATSGIRNDIDQLFQVYPGVLPLNSNPNQFIVDVHPQDLKNQIESKGSNMKYAKVFKNLEIESNDNPVLLIYKKNE